MTVMAKFVASPDQYCQPDQQAFGLASEIAAAYGVRKLAWFD